MRPEKRAEKRAAAKETLQACASRLWFDWIKNEGSPRSDYVAALVDMGEDDRLAQVVPVIRRYRVTPAMRAFFAAKAPLPEWMCVLELFMHTAACAVRDKWAVRKPEQNEANRDALREDAKRRRELSLEVRLAGRHDEADALWRDAVVCDWNMAELPREDDPSVIRHHAWQRRGVPNRERDLGEVERLARARGVLAIMHALARDVFARQAPEVAAAFASAVTRVSLTRDDVRRITLKETSAAPPESSDQAVIDAPS